MFYFLTTGMNGYPRQDYTEATVRKSEKSQRKNHFIIGKYPVACQSSHSHDGQSGRKAVITSQTFAQYTISHTAPFITAMQIMGTGTAVQDRIPNTLTITIWRTEFQTPHNNNMEY